jgi:gamma-butyrobetaine dioxygenase
LALADPEAFEVLSTLLIEFRYDIGTDVKIASAPLIDLHPDGSLRQLRYSPRLDYAPAADPEVLDIYYRGRRWLAEQLNSPSRRIELRMGAGDVLVVDNHRVLHGRSSFDPTRGHRHLQGCYIDHDGPETQWRLARRRTTIDRQDTDDAPISDRRIDRGGTFPGRLVHRDAARQRR